MANPRGFLDAAGDGPLTFGQRLAGDPRIAKVIEGNLPALSQIDPQLAARLQQRDPEAIFEAYQMIVGSGGRLKAPAQAEPFSAVDAPARQMDLGLAGDNAPPSRAMIPFGTRGPGVPVGQPMGPGMRGDNVAVHNAFRDSWPMPYDSEADDVMAALGEFSPQQQQYLRALEANDWLGFDYPSQAASAGLSGDATRNFDMSEPLIAARQSLINTNVRGPGTARDVRGDMILSRLRGIGTNAAPLYNPGREMIPAPMRGLPFTPSQPARIMGPQNQIAAQFDRALSPASADAMTPDEMAQWRTFADDWNQQQPLATDASGRIVMRERPVEPMSGESLGGADGGIPRYRQGDMPPAPPARSKLRDVAAAGAAAAGGAALIDMMAPLETGGEADLASETRPAPVVEATPETPEPTVLQAPVDYSLEARRLIDQLNTMRRAAGGEVPEAPAMQREIQRLLDLGNKTRKATYAAAPQDDPSRMYQQAQGLIDQVNQMYRQGMTPNSPQVRQIMAKVRQLQSQGDAMRNRRSA